MNLTHGLIMIYAYIDFIKFDSVNYYFFLKIFLSLTSLPNVWHQFTLVFHHFFLLLLKVLSWMINEETRIILFARHFNQLSILISNPLKHVYKSFHNQMLRAISSRTHPKRQLSSITFHCNGSQLTKIDQTTIFTINTLVLNIAKFSFYHILVPKQLQRRKEKTAINWHMH